MAVFLFTKAQQLNGEMVFLWNAPSKKKPPEISKSHCALNKSNSKSQSLNNVENILPPSDVDVCKDGLSLAKRLLNGSYELWQFHLHWGSADDHGSAHTIEG